MHPFVASCFSYVIIASSVSETFPPTNWKQWLSVASVKLSPDALAKCGLPKAEKQSYSTHKPKIFFVVQNPFQAKDPATDQWSFLTRYAKVFLLKQGGCQEVFTCHVQGDGDMGSIYGRAGVMVNAQHVYQFFCAGEADNAQFYHVRIDTSTPTITAGPAVGDMDTRDAITGETYH